MQAGGRKGDARTPSLLSRSPHAVGNIPQGCVAPSHPSGMRSVLSSSGGKKALSFAEHSWTDKATRERLQSQQRAKKTTPIKLFIRDLAGFCSTPSFEKQARQTSLLFVPISYDYFYNTQLPCLLYQKLEVLYYPIRAPVFQPKSSLRISLTLWINLSSLKLARRRMKAPLLILKLFFFPHNKMWRETSFPQQHDNEGCDEEVPRNFTNCFSRCLRLWTCLK